MFGKLLRRTALAAAAMVPGIALAQDAPPADKISGVAGVTFTTDYISRGLLLENQGFIAQPFGELYFDLYEGEGFIKKFGVYGGAWSSLHENKTDAGALNGGSSTTEIWYEFDWYGGVTANMGDLSAVLTYYEFVSPSDAFGTSNNLELKLSYNDAALWGGAPYEGFALNPYVKIFWETDGKAGTGSDEGVYFEVGVAPAYTFNPESDYPVTLAVPVNVGLGASDFYNDANRDGGPAGFVPSGDNKTFGFASIGLTASVPLPFLADYGSWTLSSGVFYYYFGEGTEDYNAAIGSSDVEDEWVGSLALTVAF